MDSILGLISELLKEPLKFYNQGKQYQLLEEYYKDANLGSLKPLLYHENIYVRRCASWITSELGAKGACLIDDAIALLMDEDLVVKNNALEIIAACSVEKNSHKFVYIVPFLECDEDALNNSAMLLISNADQLQLEESIKHYKNNFDSVYHHAGLTELLKIHRGLLELLEIDTIKQIEFISYCNEQVVSMICGKELLKRRYGIIIAKKMFTSNSSSIIPILNKVSYNIYSQAKR
jgi:hypothetical protein